MSARTTRYRAERTLRAHPEFVALFLVAGVVVAVSVSSLMLLGGMILLPCGVLLSKASSRALLARRLLTLLPVGVLCALLRALGVHDGAAVHIIGLGITTEGLVAGVAAMLRIFAAASWAAWLSASLSPPELVVALMRLGMPRGLVELIELTHRFAQQLRPALASAWAAAALRGGFVSWRAMRATVGPVAGTVIVRALDRSEQVAVVLALRGGAMQKEQRERSAPTWLRAAAIFVLVALGTWIGVPR